MEWSYSIESSRRDEAPLLNILLPASSSSFYSFFSTTSPTYDLRHFHSSRLVLTHSLYFHSLGRACGRLAILHKFLKTYCHTNRPVIRVNISRAKLRLPVSSIAIVDRYVIYYCQYEHSLLSGTPYTLIIRPPLNCGKNLYRPLFIRQVHYNIHYRCPALLNLACRILFVNPPLSNAINTVLATLHSILRIRTPHKHPLTKQTDKTTESHTKK